MSLTHCDFTCTVTGLIINTDYLHLGASPDEMTQCRCCGSGLVEIKCPFSVRNLIFVPKTDEIKEKLTFLSQNGKLKISHKYYIQIQGQLSIADQYFCDFVIWIPKCLIIERTYWDINLWEKIEKTDWLLCSTYSARNHDKKLYSVMALVTWIGLNSCYVCSGLLYKYLWAINAAHCSMISWLKAVRHISNNLIFVWPMD